MNKLLVGAVIASLSIPVLAWDSHPTYKRHNDGVERVKVQKVTKITKPYTKKVRVGEECYEDTVEVPVSCGVDTNSIGVDTLIGTTLGIALGNQVGNGSGREVARVVGGILGATTANRMRDNGCKTYETVTQCNPSYEYKTKYKTIGYNNCAEIDGVEYCKQTQKPIKFLKVKRTIKVW